MADEHEFPIRKCLNHRTPFRAADAFFFVTICAAVRGGNEMVDRSRDILDAARHYHLSGKWFVALCLVMPDHVHLLVHVPNVAVVGIQSSGGRGRPPLPVSVGRDVFSGGRGHPPLPVSVGRDVLGAPQSRSPSKTRGLSGTIGDFKSFLAKTAGLDFQSNYFDTRIRDEAHFAEKWKYIVRNPVVRGLVATPREWPHSIAFNRQTGEELPHR